MDFGNFTFRQIETDTEIKSFDCGDADLNDLKKDMEQTDKTRLK